MGNKRKPSTDCNGKDFSKEKRSLGMSKKGGFQKKIIIRSSTAEFLIFAHQSKGEGIEVLYERDTIWLTQKLMAELFQTSTDNISLHLKNIFNDKELDEKATTEDFSVVQKEGSRSVRRSIKFYNLDAIISVGYRVNSQRATQFRQWATSVLKKYAVKGYVMDKQRMENGSFLGEDYFEHLLAEICTFLHVSHSEIWRKKMKNPENKKGQVPVITANPLKWLRF